MSDETPRADVSLPAIAEPQQAGGAAVQFTTPEPPAVALSPEASPAQEPPPARRPLSTPPIFVPPRPAPSAPPRPATPSPAVVQRAEDWIAASAAQAPGGDTPAVNARRKSRRQINALEPVEPAPVPEPPPTVRMPSSRVPPPGTNIPELSPVIPPAPLVPERSSDPGSFPPEALAPMPEPEDVGPVIQPMRIIPVASDLPAVPGSVPPPPLVPPGVAPAAFMASGPIASPPMPSAPIASFPVMERLAPPPPPLPFSMQPRAEELETGWTPYPAPVAAPPLPEPVAAPPEAVSAQPEEIEALEEVEPESAEPEKPQAPPLPVRKPVTQAEAAVELEALPEARAEHTSDPAEEIEPESQPELPPVASPPPLPVRKIAPTLDGDDDATPITDLLVALAPEPIEEIADAADESVEVDLNIPDSTEQPSAVAVEVDADALEVDTDEALPRKPPPPPPRRASIPQIDLSPAETAALSASPPPAIAAPAPAPPLTTPKPPPPLIDSTRRRQKPWWEELFGDDYIRTMDRLDRAAVRREVDIIEASLGVERGAAILDLACGAGQHAVELASRGYGVVGYDLSLAMLALAADEAQERGQKLNFLQGDMREMAFESVFDGVYCLATSFGYFDDEKNVNVLQRMHRALRPGGTLLLDVANRDYVSPRSPSLVWFEGDGCVCMDDMYVDFFTSRLKVKRTVMFDDGRSRELDYSIRLYSLHELGKMMHESGFKVVEVTGHPAHQGVFFGSESPRIIVVAERS